MSEATASGFGVRELALRAKEASRALAQASGEERDRLLIGMAKALEGDREAIVAANARDVAAAREAGTPEPLIDRLLLDEGRVRGMAAGLRALAALPDPLAAPPVRRTLASGVELSQIRVPLGLVAMVYEARPNVTSDAAGICLKAGNACLLRGGSLALRSNEAVASALSRAVAEAGFPAEAISLIATTDRGATDELLGLRGIVDVLIPRGGAGLIAHCVEHASVPVIETGTGNCHVYVRAPFDRQMALSIVENAKCSRPGVCNACESLLFDATVSDEDACAVLSLLAERGVRIHADEALSGAAERMGIPVERATEVDWGREYLALEISAKRVSGVGEAIAHVNRYGTGHSECIVTDDEAAARAFLSGVDAAAVYWNASTRFTDGGEFGLGAEIGISTQKLHARGPFALEALTTTKHLLVGKGQVR